MKYRSSWRSPSNIALIKYWGKHGVQLPRNPSLSFTLSACFTEMTMEVDLHSPSSLSVNYDSKPAPAFKSKIQSFFEKLTDLFPWLTTSAITLDSKNTFPHGAGIASSASSMSALALCVQDIDDQMNPRQSRHDNPWKKMVSGIARLGSGSACRSLFPVAALWGKTEGMAGSSDEYAIPWKDEIHPIFHTYQDTILVVSASEKAVSSSAGHAFMDELPYASVRYEVARHNLQRLIECMKYDDRLEEFISICESEALQLHALMMSGHSPYILMEPNTLSIIHEVWRFRKETNIPVCFTLDAGPNVHLLYPASYRDPVLTFIQDILIEYCHSKHIIHDHTGDGPARIDPLV